MTQRNAVAIVNLSLCGLLVLGGLLTLSGCKSPYPFGLAKQTGPESASDIQLVSADVMTDQTRGTAKAAQQPGTESGKFSLSKTIRQATAWISIPHSDDDSFDQTRMLDRKLTQSSGDANAQAPWESLAYSRKDPRTRSLGRTGLAQSTPSLVRHSRRPPPDPAPKPPQEELLATKKVTRNPYVSSEAKPGTAAGAAAKKPVSALATASSATQANRTSVVAANSVASNPAASAQASPTTNNADFKFLPPNIEKIIAASNAGSANRAKKMDRDTIPRRQDLLAGNARSTNKNGKPAALKTHSSSSKPHGNHPAGTSSPAIGPSGTGASHAKPAAYNPTSHWVAKTTPAATTTPAKKKPKLSTTKTATAQPDSKQVVAETFANNMFVPHKNAPAQPARPVTSSLRLPAPKPQVASSSAPKSGTDHLATRPHGLTAKKPQAAAAPAAARSFAATPPTTAAAPATSTLTSAKTSRPATRSPMAWRRPKPIAPNHNSYEAYYRRGVLPGAESLYRPSQAPAAVVAHRASKTPAVPATNQLAPLVDAASYRRQIAQRQQANVAIPTSATQATGKRNWLAAYQKLVRDAQNRDVQHPPAPAGSPSRSLHSRD